MKYIEKVQYAEVVADALLAGTSLEEIKNNLESQSLYEGDINKVVSSARKIIGERFKPLIKEKLLNGTELEGLKELDMVDESTLIIIIQQVERSLGISEKTKVRQLLEKGVVPEEIFPQVDQRFYPKDLIDDQIQTYVDIEKENSGGGRILNIVGGILIMIFGGVFSYSSLKSGGTGRLFYGIVVFGLVMVFNGLIPKPHSRY